MFNYLKRNILVIIIIFVMIALALFFIIPSGETFIKLFSYIAFAYLVLLGLSFFVIAYPEHNVSLNKDNRIILILQGLFLIALAVLILIFQNYVMRVIIGICLLIIPTFKLIESDNRFKYLLNNFWKFLIGILFILALNSIIKIVFMVFGILLIVAVFYLIYLLVINYRKDKPNIAAMYFIHYIVKRSNM